MRILVAEDDGRLLKSLVHILSMHHFSVDGVDNGADALEYAGSGAYDGLVLDIMMPGLEGLNAGADDYLPKPFSTDELLARVRAMLRRRDFFTPDLLTLGAVSLNRSTYELSCREQTLSLSGKEFQVLELLMEHPRIVLSTDQIITRVWGWDTDVDTSVVWVHISNLRKKLNALSAPVRLRFLRGAGYVLEELP